MAILADQDCNDQLKTIYFQPGLISLTDFIKQKQKQDPSYCLDSNLVTTLFQTLLQFVMMLSTKECFHNDIKPDNILFVNSTESSSNSGSQNNNNNPNTP